MLVYENSSREKGIFWTRFSRQKGIEKHEKSQKSRKITKNAKKHEKTRKNPKKCTPHPSDPEIRPKMGGSVPYGPKQKCRSQTE